MFWGRATELNSFNPSECTFLTPSANPLGRKTSAFNCKQTTPNLLLPDSLLLALSQPASFISSVSSELQKVNIIFNSNLIKWKKKKSPLILSLAAILIFFEIGNLSYILSYGLLSYHKVGSVKSKLLYNHCT